MVKDVGHKLAWCRLTKKVSDEPSDRRPLRCARSASQCSCSNSHISEWIPQTSNHDRPHVLTDKAMLDVCGPDVGSDSKRAGIIGQTISGTADNLQGISGRERSDAVTERALWVRTFDPKGYQRGITHKLRLPPNGRTQAGRTERVRFSKR